jgi:acetyl esterase
VIAEPMEAQRALDERLGIAAVGPGPQLAAVSDHLIPARGRRVACRLYRPSTGTALPVAVYFHGGGWVWSSVETHDRLARELALASGAAVLSVDYALAPEARFPAALLECAAVVRHVAANGAALDLDASRIVLAGDSAGGNLALATALLLRDTEGPPLRGILAFYPVCDADFTAPSYQEFDSGFGLTTAAMQALWAAYLAHPADRWNPLAAPLRGRLAGLPPVLLQLAELDVLRSEGEAMAQALQAAGVAVTCETFAGMAHGFVRHTARVARAREALARAGAWVAERVVSG